MKESGKKEIKLLPLEGGNGKFILIINLIGAFCTLLGLIEIIRLVIFYWGTYGLLANFPLEITVYVIGVIWTLTALINFVGPGLRFLDAVGRISPRESPIETDRG